PSYTQLRVFFPYILFLSLFLYILLTSSFFFFFFFNDPPTTEIYTLSLHDALPISSCKRSSRIVTICGSPPRTSIRAPRSRIDVRSEEHTSELQSRGHLVCRLLLEKKKTNKSAHNLFFVNLLYQIYRTVSPSNPS